MYISLKNYHKLNWIYYFCKLYKAHRDFDLAKRVAKNNPLKWEQAESLASFCNQIVTTKTTKPEDFISDDNTNANEAIEKYLILKECIKQIKYSLGAKNKDKIYKSVKSFYRKKMYCYQMDSFFTWLISGAVMYVNDFITFEQFKRNYCFEISLFSGTTKPINIRQVIKISQYILSC